jgi:GIY-YIG catalytic domain-containing protein
MYPIRRRHPRISIYALVDPRDRKVRYVGRTRAPKRRLSSLLCAPAIDNRRRHNWIKRLAARGLVPTMIILETCSLLRSPVVEAKWIQHHGSRGTLYNGTQVGVTDLRLNMSIRRGERWHQ